jgi:NAD(P)-dependent dehydrogenase (short-subunit alcohol dehydrogenase family)
VIAVVTGGSRGIGQAIADALGSSGVEVTTLSRSEGLDVNDASAVERAIAAVGAVDLLVNNAGTLDAIGPAWKVDTEDWRRDVETSLLGAFNCSRAVLPGMIERGRGRIVNVASGAAERAYPYGSGYAAGKAALISFTRSLAAETAEHGIAVFAIAPGFVWTEMTERLRDASGPAPDVSGSDPLAPELAGRLVLRLASGEADKLTGEFIHVRDDLDELLQRSAD